MYIYYIYICIVYTYRHMRLKTFLNKHVKKNNQINQQGFSIGFGILMHIDIFSFLYFLCIKLSIS